MLNEQEVLEGAGLSANEAKIYLLLARSGKLKATEVSVKTGLQRRTVYDTLNQLEKKGLAGRASISGILAFTASPPSSLRTFIEGKREALEKILPGLSKSYEAEDRTDVSVMYGNAGIMTVLLDILGLKPDSYYAYHGQMQFFDNLPKFMQIFNDKRRNFGIRTKYLLIDTPQVRERAPRMSLATIKFIDPSTISPGVWWTYADRIILFVLPKGGESLTIFIKNKELAKTFRGSFERMFKSIKQAPLKTR